jgi:hypothetical protein
LLKPSFRAELREFQRIGKGCISLDVCEEKAASRRLLSFK